MTLENRVAPDGSLQASATRGLLFGNRGGRFHRDDRTLGRRRWASRQWICCVLDFKNRRRDVWGRYYTELFFLDEVTALSAGHRPCFECRRRAATDFVARWASARGVPPPKVDALDRILDAERRNGHAKRHAEADIATLADGAMILLAAEAPPHAVRGDALLPWSQAGYGAPLPRPRAGKVRLLTPPSIAAALREGYRPLWHPSADISTLG